MDARQKVKAYFMKMSADSDSDIGADGAEGEQIPSTESNTQKSTNITAPPIMVGQGRRPAASASKQDGALDDSDKNISLTIKAGDDKKCTIVLGTQRTR